jgi:rare lipoprotein A
MRLLAWVAVASALLLTACGKAHVSYAPDYAKPATTAKVPTGKGGYRKTGKPYQVGGRWYYPLQSAAGYDETGTASWYGNKFHGRKTANGERYDMYAMSAAHKTLPMPTLVRVTNLENGRQIVVRVNDRGPFVKNRLIDLSYAAAKALGYDGKGTAHVRVQALDGAPANSHIAAAPGPAPAIRHPAPRPAAPVPTARRAAAPAGHMYVQLGAFASAANAERLQRSLLGHYPGVRVFQPTSLRPGMYRVRIGPISDVKRIEALMLSLQNDGYDNAIVVVE